MTKQVLLIKYAEIHLKGLNRPFFERRLLDGLRKATKAVVDCRAAMRNGRYYIEDYDPAAQAELIEAVRRVFGVHSVCPAVCCAKDPDAITETACELMAHEAHDGATFKVQVKRSDKGYPTPSMELARELGGRILERFDGLRVDVHHPDILLNVEVRVESAYLYTRELPGHGGMPLGTSGKGTLLLSGGIDSPVAGWMMMKRGVRLIAVHFHSFPYTSEHARQKVLDLARVLAGYGGGIPVHVVPFTAIQEKLYEEAPEQLMTLLMRRAMMRIAQQIAVKNGCGALVTGESLGQVASQTMEGLQATGDGLSLPVLRPLIGFDKEDIITRAREIGTYDISVRPYEDCCTVFTPRHPATRPRLETVREAEAAVNLDALIDEALAGTVVEQIRSEG